ncbi:P-loop containing nucleoside triphosphate hydrolase protein [Morchella snyderi]|nr:P-loop containing nucleoside triphosphate hydrolase protein [Morchella snyderi]
MMENIIDDLVNATSKLLAAAPPASRVLISVSGIPGSGKTTLAGKVVNRLNALDPNVAAMIPMDGYHLTRAALSAMPNPLEAHARRGAPFTFDPVALKQLVLRLRAPITSDSGTIFAPSFDHAKKDPVEDDIAILATQRILVFEGNYLSLRTEIWGEISVLFDELWFVSVDRDVARKRLIARHLMAGLADTEEAAAKRADENDLVNGDYIVENMCTPSRVIRSVEDLEYANSE